MVALDHVVCRQEKESQMIRVHQVKCTDPKKIEESLLKKLNMPKQDLLSWSIHRKSMDARGQKVLFSFVLDVEAKHEKKYLKKKDVIVAPDERFLFTPSGQAPLENRPVVVGFGPAGMFAALLLAQYGYKPLIVERGSAIEKRSLDVETFWKEGLLNPESNVQFGMGGAGAFSDGKLTTRSKNLKVRKVFEELVKLGANPDILYEQHPHVGTDGFVRILQNLRQEIERLGGEFLFDHRLDDVKVVDGKLRAICLSSTSEKEEDPSTQTWMDCQALILAIGHSACDTIRMLNKRGLMMEGKPFAIGVRIEHLQEFINKAMVKDQYQNPAFVPARYQLTQTVSTGKGVYSFCMCPGGYVIAAACEPNTVVVNGMSYSDRGGENANAALLVQVDKSDTGEDVFDGLRYQEDLEKKAYALSNSYKAPVQLAKDFVNNRVSDHFEEVKPTYPLGTIFTNFHDLLPKPIASSLQEALIAFDKKVPGFLKGAVLTGVETRSSSSIRMPRNKENLESNIQGLYPCGEGSGYSGGIMTSAIDGLQCAMALMDHFDKPEKVSLK